MIVMVAIILPLHENHWHELQTNIKNKQPFSLNLISCVLFPNVEEKNGECRLAQKKTTMRHSKFDHFLNKF